AWPGPPEGVPAGVVAPATPGGQARSARGRLLAEVHVLVDALQLRAGHELHLAIRQQVPVTRLDGGAAACRSANDQCQENTDSAQAVVLHWIRALLISASILAPSFV